LSPDHRAMFHVILDEKIKSIFAFAPESAQHTNAVEFARFECSEMREKVQDSEHTNAQLRGELGNLRHYLKAAEVRAQQSSVTLQNHQEELAETLDRTEHGAAMDRARLKGEMSKENKKLREELAAAIAAQSMQVKSVKFSRRMSTVGNHLEDGAVPAHLPDQSPRVRRQNSGRRQSVISEPGRKNAARRQSIISIGADQLPDVAGNTPRTRRPSLIFHLGADNLHDAPCIPEQSRARDRRESVVRRPSILFPDMFDDPSTLPKLLGASATSHDIKKDEDKSKGGRKTKRAATMALGVGAFAGTSRIRSPAGGSRTPRGQHVSALTSPTAHHEQSKSSLATAETAMCSRCAGLEIEMSKLLEDMHVLQQAHLQDHHAEPQSNSDFESTRVDLIAAASFHQLGDTQPDKKALAETVNIHDLSHFAPATFSTEELAAAMKRNAVTTPSPARHVSKKENTETQEPEILLPEPGPAEEHRILFDTLNQMQHEVPDLVSQLRSALPDAATRNTHFMDLVARLEQTVRNAADNSQSYCSLSSELYTLRTSEASKPHADVGLLAASVSAAIVTAAPSPPGSPARGTQEQLKMLTRPRRRNYQNSPKTYEVEAVPTSPRQLAVPASVTISFGRQDRRCNTLPAMR